MTRCFGLLGSGQAADSERVGLAVEDDMLTAIEPGGTSWNIPLDRVHLVSWSSEELQLELAGSRVSFVPEDPDATLAQLVPPSWPVNNAGWPWPECRWPAGRRHRMRRRLPI